MVYFCIVVAYGLVWVVIAYGLVWIVALLHWYGLWIGIKSVYIV
jgi:hypothetical protein